MKTLYFIILFFGMTFSMHAQSGIPVSEMTACDVEVQNLLSTYNIPGATMAVALKGKLSYARAFGKADIGLAENMQPYNMFRIASVSKPITAITIMKMIENGQLNLSDKVFGTGGLLENHWYLSNANITDSRIYDITVQMLLEHSGGFDRSQNCFPSPTSPYPYFFSGCDPINAPLYVTQTLSAPNPATEEMLVTFLLEKGLDFNPGTAFAYSNIGYLILGEVIEEISGKSYEDYVKQIILHPLGIYDMHLAKNLLANKREREGEYIGEGYTNLSIYGDGAYVPWEYGGANHEAMDAHGGWIATARDLMRLLVAVDRFTTSPDILSYNTITSMITPSSNYANYAKGWSVNQYNNWWHTGAVDGTASIWVRTSSDYHWAIILNKRITTGQANNFWAALDSLGWDCIAGTTAIPAHDFFDAPTVSATNLNAANISDITMDISWTNGSGSNRLVVAKEVTGNSSMNHFSAYPLDGTDYTANNQFGSGDDLGDGSFVVYNGMGTSFSLTGLNPERDYAIRVYEYTKTTNTGNNALYLLGNLEELNASTTALGLNDWRLKNNIKIYPTLVSEVLNISFNNEVIYADFTIYSIIGSVIDEGNLIDQQTINVSNLQSGLYIIQFRSEGKMINHRFVKK
jgi:CubicO group peptidase (beta-lactamase class C family)